MLYDVVDQFERKFVKNNHSCLQDLFVELYHFSGIFTCRSPLSNSMIKALKRRYVPRMFR